ncbi:MAG TPA: hypothetical protein ENG02_00800, partial [Candidatus Woesearchaeota archaeon]|nr:hypothetical protein [Candidatus Woesearchaeota archaeon]
MNQTELKKKIISFIEKGLLISPDMLERMPDKIDTKKDIVVLTPEIIENKNNEINWKEFERIKSLYEHGKTEPYNKFLSTIKEQPKLSERKEELNDVEVIFSYQEKSHERSVSDFIALFTARYQTIRKFLQIRPELQNLLSISKVKSKKEKEELSIIGLVAEKQVTKNKNILLKVEDPTGTIAVLVSANKPDLYNEAKTIVEDEVIG